MKTGFGMTAYNDGKAEQKRELASDKKYNNIKPDIGFFGEALNWGGGAKGDISPRARSATASRTTSRCGATPARCRSRRSSA